MVSLTEHLKGAAGKELKNKEIVEGANNAMLSAAVRLNARVGVAIAPDRAKLKNRDAQRRFRAEWGNRLRYARIGQQTAQKAPPKRPFQQVDRPIRRSALGIPIRGG